MALAWGALPSVFIDTDCACTNRLQNKARVMVASIFISLFLGVCNKGYKCLALTYGVKPVISSLLLWVSSWQEIYDLRCMIYDLRI
jgi:hypothetical protein